MALSLLILRGVAEVSEETSDEKCKMKLAPSHQGKNVMLASDRLSQTWVKTFE